MIVFDFDTVTETVTRPDGTEETVEKRGDVRVWFSQSDPETDSPDQTYDWKAETGGITLSAGDYPTEVKSVCAKREIDSELSGNQPFNQYVFEIYRDLMTEQIEQR
jgi:cytochrome oxidase Cu insertion factor (SCO1/SenC/PrrC family)